MIIWTRETENGVWNKKPLKKEKFGDAVWKLSWSASGNILAVSSGDNKVSLWKENLDGEWICISEIEEGGPVKPQEAVPAKH